MAREENSQSTRGGGGATVRGGVTHTKSYQRFYFLDYICQNSGVCQDNLKQGFRCQCQNENYEGQLCRVTTRSFENGSFAAFPGI